jgi:hypothetical protein
MKTKSNSGIVIFSKLFTFGIGMLALMGVIDKIISPILGRKISTGFLGLDVWGIFSISFIISLLSIPNYLHTVKAIRMDDQAISTELVIRAMDKMKWKIESQTEREIIFKSSFLLPPWKERIIIKFTDTELQIGGPRECVERAIQLSNFSYGAFEISNFE